MIDPKDRKPDHSQNLFPVSLYLKIFFALLAMIFINMGIAQLPLSNAVITGLLILVASIQTILVAAFYMELIHEDKFYAFIFSASILFMLLFFMVSLLEIRGRGVLDPIEGTKYMRQIDKNGNFAPDGPKIKTQEQIKE